MKLVTSIIASAVIAFASAGQVNTGTNYQHQQSRGFTAAEQQYQQQRHQNIPQAVQSHGQARPQIQSRHFQARPQYQARPDHHQARPEQSARILSYTNENDGHNYQYAYETDNGIKAQEAGQTIDKGTQAQGGFSYTGDDGHTYTVTYTADENGFRPQGDHLPTPPPIPEAIAKALEQNAHEAANGVCDDGSYKEQPQDYHQTTYQQSQSGSYQLGNNYQYQQSYQQPRAYQQNNYQFQSSDSSDSDYHH